MKPRKEDHEFVDQLLEMYVEGAISRFDSYEISREFKIEAGYGRHIRDVIRDLNEELSFFRVDVTNSGDFYPLEDGKFQVKRFLEDGGSSAHFEDSFSLSERRRLTRKIDSIVSGQIMLAEGQHELNQQISEILPSMKPQLSSLSRKVWIAVLRNSVLTAGLGLGINTENLQSLIQSVEKSLDL